MMTSFFIILILLFFVPFVPGIRELVKKADADPLFINMDYCKESRYFGLSFRRVFLASLKDHPIVKGLHSINLSKQETAEIADNISIADGNVLPTIYYIQKDLKSGKQVTFEKEVYVRESAYIGENNQVRALACDRDVHILSGTKFIRWLDAEGNIRAEEKVDLGISTSCGKELSLAQRCSFRRLSGFPIITDLASVPLQGRDTLCGADIADHEAAVTCHLDDINQKDGKAIVFEGERERNLSSIASHSRKDCSIITDKSLTIGEYTVIRGHIKTHGNLFAEGRVIITGNVFAEGDIRLGPHCWVLGSVFTQGHIVFEEGVKIGSREGIKSVISKKGIAFHSGVKIYGYVSTEGEGKVV